MAPELVPLASGSLGNALLVRSERAAVLVDMGLTQRALRAALAAVGAAIEQVDAVLVTHTHRDHFSSAAAGLCLRHDIPVYSTRANLESLARSVSAVRKLVRAGLLRPVDGEAFTLGEMAVAPFALPHDAPGECLGFRFSMGPKRRRRIVATATDLGHVPGECIRNFLDADAVVIESNHDPVMLLESGRPWDLIERISGPAGHLANDEAAEAVAEIIGRSRPGRVRHVVLAHLSRDCNTPRMALEAQARLAGSRAGRTRFAAAAQFEPGPAIPL